jgi:hypothetical protein
MICNYFNDYSLEQSNAKRYWIFSKTNG